MAAKKTGLGRGLDALFPEKKHPNKPETGAETKKGAEKQDIKASTETKTALTEQQQQVSNSGEHDTVQKESTFINGSREVTVNTSQPQMQSQTQSPAYSEGVIMVKLSKVEPNREQPRKKFDEDALLELSESVKQYGILQPLLVSDKKDYYEIIAGERRWRAAKMAGLKEVPVLIKEFSDQEIVEISLIENIQREDLNPIEEALAYKRLIDEFHMKQDEVAERVSKSRTAVTNSMRLLKLTSKVQEMVVDEMISAGHARAILGLTDPAMQETVAAKVFDHNLSVRETEDIVRKILRPVNKKEAVSNPAEDAIYESLEEKMKGITGTRVFIHRKKNNKGKIEIEYYSRDDLDRIIDLFESIR